MEQMKPKNGKGVPFERVRRITGYLVGSMDKWNEAKRAEEAARVKHTMLDPWEMSMGGRSKNSWEDEKNEKTK